MSTSHTHARTIAVHKYGVSATYSDQPLESFGGAVELVEQGRIVDSYPFRAEGMSDAGVREELSDAIANYFALDGRDDLADAVDAEGDEDDMTPPPASVATALSAARLLGEAKMTLQAANGITAVWAQGGSRIDITQTEDNDTIVLESYPTTASTYADVAIAMTDALVDYLDTTTD